MSRLTKEQRGIDVWLTNAGIRQAELSETFYFVRVHAIFIQF